LDISKQRLEFVFLQSKKAFGMKPNAINELRKVVKYFSVFLYFSLKLLGSNSY
jgi:hypothetical protein